ncbi:hypothetical protein AAVH_16758 [Aphelenchoides avenae]|nr:hypothetical protein AAVH_16758 [Aphelenchus avenae]
MLLAFDLFDIFACLDRPSLDKAAYVCRRFDAVIEEERMKSWCLRTISQVLVEGESTTYNITLRTAHRSDGRASLQFRRVNFQDKLRTFLRRSVIDEVELKGVGVNEKFLAKIESGLDQTNRLTLTNVVFPTRSSIKLLLSSFKDLQVS